MIDSQGAAKAAPAFDEQKVKTEISWLGARLREPSTYAGLSSLAAAAALFHLIPDGSGANLVKYITMIGMGAGGLIAILLPEAGRPRPKPPGPSISSAALVLFAIALAILAFPVHAQPRLKLPIPLPQPRPGETAPRPALDPLADFMTQLEAVKADTITAVVADITAADDDAATIIVPAIPAQPGNPNATPPVPPSDAVPAQVRDPIAHACYPALIKFLQSTPTFQPPTGKLVGVQLFQRKRDFVAQLNAGLPTYLKLGCAPLLGDEINTFIKSMALIGVKILPAGIAAICPPCAAAVAPIALPALTLTP